MTTANDNTKNAVMDFHKPAYTPAELDDLLKQGRQSKPDVASGSNPYLRMNKNDGEWCWGPENIEVEPESQWQLLPISFSHGFVAWSSIGKREKLPNEIMVPCTKPVEQPDIDYSDRGGTWQKQIGFELVCINGADQGQGVMYRATSIGGKKAYNALYDACADRPNPEYTDPIVVLDYTVYKHPNYKTDVYEPDFQIIGWMNANGDLLPVGENVAKLENASEAGEDDTIVTAPEAPPKQRKSRSRAA